ncbi:hypothetical protein BKA83DRAFT_17076 [Pisolithus microcarpus]|nr:hypothetical protein BKA83DRAFT_17076 [Pisolithus microcarpus]
MPYESPDSSPFVTPPSSPESVTINTPPIPPAYNRESAPSGLAHTPLQHSYYPSGPVNLTPDIRTSPSFYATPIMPPRPEAPDSYYPPPVPLSNGYGPSAAPPPGTPADMPHYPNVVATPWGLPTTIPPPPPMWPPQHPPALAHAPFPPPLPYGPPPWAMPAGYYPQTAAGWGPPMPPPTMTPYVHPAETPWMDPANPPPGPPLPQLGAPPAHTAHANVRWTSNLDHVDPFAEGSHYGPVLEPFLSRVVGAVIKINPLLAPPGDSLEDQLRWNMLFRSSSCYRTTDSRRSWVKGREAPATYPRLTYVRIVSRSFPWMIRIAARDQTLGVTCGEILDGISDYLYSDVTKKELENVSKTLKRHIFSAYEHNRSTDPNVPGGRLGTALKRLDWLGNDTRFGGLVANDKFIEEHCGDILPATFELKCQPNRPPTAQELHEQPFPTKAARSTNGSRSTPSGSVKANELHGQPLRPQGMRSPNGSQFTPCFSSTQELHDPPLDQQATRSANGPPSTRSDPVTANKLHEQGPLGQQALTRPPNESQSPPNCPPMAQPHPQSLHQKATRSAHSLQSSERPFSLVISITFDGIPSGCARIPDRVVASCSSHEHVGEISGNDHV